ncbi:MAG: tRNA uridine(34) 5-carboxymethylaminomethyl modification radical SAM/GNAT enzyme Elp3 [Thermoplasmatota archaeon]
MSEKPDPGGRPRRSDEWESDPDLRGIVARISEKLIDGSIRTREELQDSKMIEVRKTSIGYIPTNSMILDYIVRNCPESDDGIMDILRKKPSRTLSGVAVVAVMTSPHSCPHGKCLFCPGGEDQDVPTPQSYTGREPAAMRGEQHDFDSFLQTTARISQLESIGHPTDKIDLILMGGTITARDVEYQEEFVKGCFDGMNGTISGSLIEAQNMNIHAPHRCIGMTFETRPDRCGPKEIDDILRLGGTRVELGFQSAFDETLSFSRRGHTVSDSITATKKLKDAGLKVNYHLMPGIPGSDPEMDIETARMIFTDERFMPDMIKIYPTLVIEGTELFEMWKRGEYEPLSTEKAAEVVAEIKKLTPPWVRIQRIQRDIPSPLVEAGVKNSNLRQLAQEVLKGSGEACRCIRCREVGHLSNDADLREEEPRSVRRDYPASGGIEVFLSLETGGNDALIGYVRLRKPSGSAERPEIDGSTSIIRELKVFGSMVPIGERSGKRWQHRGFGSMLMEEAERISSEEWGHEKMAVNSGVGVRNYYEKLGYRMLGPYMVKKL